MFDWLKKDKISMVQIDTVLGELVLGDKSLSDLITKKTLTKDVLELDLNVPNGTTQDDIEMMYQTLQKQLSVLGVAEVNLNVAMPKVQTHTPSPPAKQSELVMHPRIRHILLVASGKGGVGKSTTAVNLALALQKTGNRVGILDADIYGPSVPDMLGVAGVKPAVENGEFVPIDAHGLAMLSIGNLLDSDSTPVAWRGIKATGALMQLYNQTAWPHLDYLLVDMPPGTGDIQLTLAQKIPVTAAIIVTTPQHIALLDAKKGVELFAKTQIPVLGIVENMALHTCSNCGHSEAIFGSGGGEQISSGYGVPLLGQLPLAKGIREQMDKGIPSVLTNDGHAQHYLSIAQNIQDRIGQFAKVRHDRRIF